VTYAVPGDTGHGWDFSLGCGPTLAVENSNDFSFTKADLELLEQLDLLDQKFEREGLVDHDQALNSYVTQVGLSMLRLARP